MTILGQREATLLVSNLEGDALLSAILQEKQLEFLGEGERFFRFERYRQNPSSQLDERFVA